MGLSLLPSASFPVWYCEPLFLLNWFQTSGTTRNEEWLFILTGDHGMNDRGGHGGSSSGEVTTALVILSSTVVDKKGSVTLLSNGARTQQVDLATFIGSVTGAGIPSTSLGIIPSDWLAKFYHDPSTQIMAVIDLLSHFARFSGCNLLTSDGALKQVVTLDPGCSSSLLTEEQVILFNNLMKQLALGLFYLEQNNTSNSTLNALASVKTHINKAIKLSQQLQSRALSGADKLDNTQMLLGGLIMWSVTLYLCLLVVRELSGKQRLSSNHTNVQLFAFKTAGQPELLSYMSSKLLCTFCTVCLLIQTISLSGSSYAEEEHQLWYFFSVSTLVLCTTLVWLGPLPWSSKRSSILCAFGILFLDRILLRQMHRTGDKWIHLPDLSDWLYSPEHSFWLWPAQILAWIVLFVMRWIAVESCSWGAGLSRNKTLARFSPLLSLLVLSLSQLYYRWTAVFGSSEQVITSARFVYLVLLMDCLCTYNWTHTNQSLHKLTFQPNEEKRFWSDLLQPVATYPLLVGLLGRPAVTILWIGILIKECLLAHVIRSFWSEDHYEQSRAMKMRLSCCWLLYWIQGWTSFFQQGNSLSLATVDVSAAYVGLRTHQPTIAGVLLTLYTYAGPLFWQMAYLTRFSLPGDLERHVTTSLACFRLGFVLLPITFCATVCYVLQSHLFIWTVFTPKLLYLAVFHIAFFPLLAIWGALHKAPTPRRTLEGLQNPGVQIACEDNLVDLEYADDIVLMFEEEEKAQVFLDGLTKVIPSFGMHFAPTKCKVMLVDMQSLNTTLTIQGEVLQVVERFTYLGSCISSDCSVTDEVNARICKARAAFANSRHLWRQNGLSLNLKGRVYQATVRAVLLYGCETWPIRAADLRRLQVFDNRCLRTIARVGWCRRIRNEAVRKRVFGCVTGTSIEECVQHQKLRWLGHVLRMPKRVLFSMPNSEWRKQRGSQHLTWQRSMKEITKRLGAVGPTRLPGWGPRDPQCAWLETLRDVTANRCQWRSC
ncbi:hypothetical protein T265_04411 [Opisthorchis viverrini]|uniref:GPI ethanolamine phosphate transferase 2 C-terminal domain-containing protein n=1 Tax=Opisthorchis viverrini TaxID=6198 RepID=A0A074ZNW5_OPIVI|nr:hypothetical protein T265_04411 [Opisthorchis viverrini]KER28801.1 hypothetical protein T265_04411 [Opisthorchis viverrini]